MTKKIETALISVSDKTGIVEFARFLVESGVRIISTGGTAKTLSDAGLEVTEVSDLTDFPEIMDGRVKTLHPKIHGGILAKRDEKSHTDAMKEHDIPPIDMVVVNLYPFRETVESGAAFNECIEQIDIGGPALIRAAAKNHKDVVVIVRSEDYENVKKEMADSGQISDKHRQELAKQAFRITGSYDLAVFGWLTDAPKTEYLSLRYGENPHQKAYLDLSSWHSQLQGKDLSYNNIADTEAALELVSEFTEPAVAIVKHANPCGVAIGKDLADAYQKALACDPISAYGGIVAFNQRVDKDTAALLADIFLEVVIAPEVDDHARKILAKKKNLRVMVTGEMPNPMREGDDYKSIAGGTLVQSRDNIVFDEDTIKAVSKRQPTEQEMADMRFAFTVCKHVKSNAIVLAKDNATVGIGAGQPSRIDSAKIAVTKTKEICESVTDAATSVMASDAFLPFADTVEIAAEHSITGIIQPGGSIRDEEVIAAANKHDIAMVFTGIRHFRH